MFQYSLCLIGQFGFLLFHDGTSNLKSTVLANLLLTAPPTASSQPLPLLAHSPSHCCPPPAIPLSLPLLLLFPSPCYSCSPPPAAPIAPPPATPAAPPPAGWVCYAEKTHGSFVLPFISTTKSPQQIMGALVKGYLAEAVLSTT